MDALGHVYVKATFYNPIEYAEYVQGKRTLEGIRKFKVKAMVDTGSTFPVLPSDVVEELGLPVIGEKEAEVAAGKGTVKLSFCVTQIKDKIAVSCVMIRPRGTTPLVGVVALEQMGYKVDPTTGRLVEGLPLMV